jgi:hypothetical protein
MNTETPQLEEVDVVAEEAHLDVKVAADLPLDDVSTTPAPQYIEDALPDTETPMLIDVFDPVETVTMNASPYTDAKTANSIDRSLTTLLQGVDEIEELAAKFKLDFTNNEQDADLPPPIRRLKSILGLLVDTLQTKYFQNIAERSGSDWGQGMEHNGAMFSAGKPKLAATADPVMRIRNELGMGSLIQIPLWHSGIWITLRTPSDTSLLELEQRMAMEKISLGRSSNGMVFSNSEIYTKNHLVDFILEHVYSVTAESKEPSFLRAIILDTDYLQLVWGMALACYPAGYPLMQPCVANPDTCTHVVSALINLARISWVDRSRLSAAQRIHMLNRANPSTVTKIEEYQKEFSATAHGEIKVNSSVSLRMRTPSLEESKTIGYAWVEQILNSTQKAFGMRLADGAREQYVQNQALLTSLRQYGQWFDAVIRSDAGKDDEVLTDRETVDEIITMIASSNEMSNQVYKAVKKYIDDSTLSMIALPKYKCPSCQGEPSAEYLKHPKLIPLDVVQVFFTLRDQKVNHRLGAEMNRMF